jgi:hypothetical protein
MISNALAHFIMAYKRRLSSGQTNDFLRQNLSVECVNFCLELGLSREV